MAEKEPEIVDLERLRQFLPIGDRQIQSLANKGVIIKGENRGEYLLTESVTGYIEHVTEKKQAPKKLSRAESADARIKEGKAEAIERKNKTANFELVLADNLELAMNDIASQWFRIMSVVCMRIRRRFPEYSKLTNEAGERLANMIESEVRKQMNLVPNLTKVRSHEVLIDDELIDDANGKLDEDLKYLMGIDGDD